MIALFSRSMMLVVLFGLVGRAMAQVSCLDSATVRELDNGLTMREAVNPSTNTITVQMVYEGEAWVGFGVSPDGEMIGADSIIGLPETGSVQQYDMSGEGLEFVTPWGSQTVSDASINQEGGVTTLTFTMPLVNDGQHEILASGPNTFLYAYGASNELAVHARAKDFTIDTALNVCGSGSGTTSSSSPPSGGDDVPNDDEASAQPKGDQEQGTTTNENQPSGSSPESSAKLLALSVPTFLLGAIAMGVF